MRPGDCAPASSIASVQQRIRLSLVRHCDVANPRGVLYGYLPGFGLSEKGLAQAESLGQRLGGQPIRGIRTSPLERARQTTSIIAPQLMRPRAPPAEIPPDSGF